MDRSESYADSEDVREECIGISKLSTTYTASELSLLEWISLACHTWDPFRERISEGIEERSVLQNKGRIDRELIKPAVDWRKTGSKFATMTASRVWSVYSSYYEMSQLFSDPFYDSVQTCSFWKGRSWLSLIISDDFWPYVRTTMFISKCLLSLLSRSC